MTGHVRRRGKSSWELKFDAGKDATGKRIVRYHSFRGTKREAQYKLAELIAAVGSDSYVKPSKVTIADYVRGRIEQWEAARSGDGAHRSTLPSAFGKPDRTADWRKAIAEAAAARFGRLARVTAVRWTRGRAGRARSPHHRPRPPRAVQGAQRRRAQRLGVRKLQVDSAPKVPDKEMAIVQDVPGLVAKLRGSRLIPRHGGAVHRHAARGGAALRWGRVD